MEQLTEVEKGKRHSARTAAQRNRRMPGWSRPEPTKLEVQQSKEFRAALGGYDAYLAAKAALTTDSPDPAI